MRPLLLDVRRARRVDVLGHDPLHPHTVEDQLGNRGSVLHVAGQGEGAAGHGEVVALNDGLEIIELDAIEPKGRLDPRVRLSEKIRAAVEPYFPPVKDHPFHVDIGWVDAVAGFDVSDVFRARIDPAQSQRPEWARIEIGEGAIAYPQSVDLEVQGHRLQRLLPSAVLQGHIAPHLGAEILEIDVELRLIKGHVRGDIAVQQSPPVDGRRQRANPCHWGVGIGVLGDRRVHQLERHRPRMHVQRVHGHGIPREPAIDLPLHVPARGLVDEERGQEGDADEDDEHSRRPDPPAAK